MGLLFNILSTVTILISYSVLMSVIQKMLLLGADAASRPPTRTLATVSSFLSSFAACGLSVSAHEYGLRILGTELSVLPIAVWGALQLMGAARSFGAQRDSFVHAGELILAGGDYDAPRFLFLGQFYGLLSGLVAVVFTHFLFW